MMIDRKRVVWTEGMMLDPHHLQQWDRYQHSTLNVRVRSIARFDWGLTELSIDRERLINGELHLQRCSGIMPDGVAFGMPDHDTLPRPRAVQEAFPATQDRLAVFLALPAEHRRGNNVTLPEHANGREGRFKAETISVVDETGLGERQIQAASPNFQLRFGTEPLDAYTTLQVAEVVRDANGSFILSESFIPTSLTLAVSEVLRGMARRLLEVLVAKSGALGGRARAILAQRELSPADMTVVGLGSTINTYIPLINHHLTTGSPPEALFTTTLALGGQLSLFISKASTHPKDFPNYDHTDLSGCFNRLDGVLREMLGDAAPPANYVQIPLQEQREHLYTAQINETLLDNAQFFIVARSDVMSEERLIADLPHMLRIASVPTIDAVLGSAIRALPLEHTTRLPAGLPVDAQANYFNLQKKGPFWEAIRDDGTLAAFVPAELASLNLNLVAVQKP